MPELSLPMIRRAALETMTPLLKAAGAAHMPPRYRGIKPYVAERLSKKLLPGDSMLSHRKREPTNLVIPGFWKHAAIYVGNGRVVEAVGKGVIETSIEEFLTTKDAVMFRRPKFLTREQLARAADHAKKLRGRPYDYLIEPAGLVLKGAKDAFYCSEVVWHSLDEACNDFDILSPFEPRLTFGVPTVTPLDISLADRLFETTEELRA